MHKILLSSKIDYFYAKRFTKGGGSKRIVESAKTITPKNTPTSITPVRSRTPSPEKKDIYSFSEKSFHERPKSPFKDYLLSKPPLTLTETVHKNNPQIFNPVLTDKEKAYNEQKKKVITKEPQVITSVKTTNKNVNTDIPSSINIEKKLNDSINNIMHINTTMNDNSLKSKEKEPEDFFKTIEFKEELKNAAENLKKNIEKSNYIQFKNLDKKNETITDKIFLKEKLKTLKEKETEWTTEDVQIYNELKIEKEKTKIKINDYYNEIKKNNENPFKKLFENSFLNEIKGKTLEEIAHIENQRLTKLEQHIENTKAQKYLNSLSIQDKEDLKNLLDIEKVKEKYDEEQAKKTKKANKKNTKELHEKNS